MQGALRLATNLVVLQMNHPVILILSGSFYLVTLASFQGIKGIVSETNGPWQS